MRELIRERQLRERETAREIEVIRAELAKAEKSGFTGQSPAELLRAIKNGLGRDAV